MTERLEQEPSESRRINIDPAAQDPTAGTTPEGLVITAGDVELAKTEYERLRSAFRVGEEAAKSRSSQTHQEIESRKFRALEVASARDRFERLSEAYDATDTGFEALSEDPASKPKHPNHDAWKARLEKAEQKRAHNDVASASRQAAEEESEENIIVMREKALSGLRAAENNYRTSPTVRSKSKYDEAAKEYQTQQRVYLYKLLFRPHMEEASRNDLRSPQTWSSLSGDKHVTRQDLWRALDMNAADKDAAAVRIGRISDVEAIRRALQRAEARQVVLDAEGAGEIDSINRRFAESLKRKRGGANA